MVLKCFDLDFRWGDWSSGPRHKHLFEAIAVRNRFTPSIAPWEEVVEEEEEEDLEDEEDLKGGGQDLGTDGHQREQHNSDEGSDDEDEEGNGIHLFLLWLASTILADGDLPSLGFSLTSQPSQGREQVILLAIATRK